MGAQAVAMDTARELLYMYGAVTQIELKNFLELVSIDDENRKRQIQANWLQATEVFQTIMKTESHLAESIKTEPLDAKTLERAEALAATPEFAATFAQYPCTFELVEIDNLVACQRNVHLEHVAQLVQNFTSAGQDLFSFCLAPPTNEAMVKIARTANNAYTLSSANPNLRFLGALQQPYDAENLAGQLPSGEPIRTITLVVGFGASTANAFRLPSGRLILANGFHRLYALRTLGVQRVPLLVQHVTHPELEMQPVVAELTREYLVETPRPALLKDFLDARLVCTVRQARFLKAVQVGWGVNESNVPS